MMDVSNSTIIVPLVKPKYKNAVRGSYVIKDGKMFFRSGKNIVYIREHFPATGATPERLVENTVRYDGENLPKTLETGDGLCYNDSVNDVL